MYLKSGAKVCVLLVGRNLDVHELFSEIFSRFGCEVMVAKDGSEALAALNVRPAHIIFSSLILGDMSGLELCRRLRAWPSLSRTVFVALTRYDEPGIARKVLNAGFHHYILKPASLAALLAPFKEIAGLEEEVIDSSLSMMQ